MSDDQRRVVIRTLNDLLRKTCIGGRVVITQGIDALGPEFVAAVVSAVRSYDGFDPYNGPWDEHDFASVRVQGASVMFKIDYYDPTHTAGSEDPSDPAKTGRVMTILLAEEY